jgi:hypothetical protein
MLMILPQYLLIGKTINGDPETLMSIGVVTAEGFEWPIPHDVFTG